MDSPQGQEQSGLRTDKLTWVVLLGRWVDFARGALALPEDDPGRRLRVAVPDIIILQAVWYALQHLGELDGKERALGLDRAQILVDRHTAALRHCWDGVPMPDLIAELIDDAQRQFASVAGP